MEGFKISVTCLQKATLTNYINIAMKNSKRFTRMMIFKNRIIQKHNRYTLLLCGFFHHPWKCISLSDLLPKSNSTPQTKVVFYLYSDYSKIQEIHTTSCNGHAQFVYKFIMIVNKGAFSLFLLKGPCIIRKLFSKTALCDLPILQFSKSAMTCNMRLWR